MFYYEPVEILGVKHYVDGKFIKETLNPDIKNHADAVKVLLDTLLDEEEITPKL